MIQTILIPVDFSETSSQAVQTGKVFAKKLGGVKVVLFHVVEEIEYYPGFVMPPIFEELKENARKELDNVAQELRAEGLPVDVEVGVGSPSQKIVQLAKSLPADLIVMGTHGRTGFSHALLGSIAEKVVRQAYCPVMTVRMTKPQTGA
jgi:nucleotide-binding universal stress UspA family protein